MKNEPVRLLLSPAEAIFLGSLLEVMNDELMEHYHELDQDQRLTLEMSQTIRKYLSQVESTQ